MGKEPTTPVGELRTMRNCGTAITFARELGISRSYLAAIEMGRLVPPDYLVEAMSKRLGLPKPALWRMLLGQRAHWLRGETARITAELEIT